MGMLPGVEMAAKELGDGLVGGYGTNNPPSKGESLSSKYNPFGRGIGRLYGQIGRDASVRPSN
jgi:hypothetical protein